jgi:hypothetical protein
MVEVACFLFLCYLQFPSDEVTDPSKNDIADVRDRKHDVASFVSQGLLRLVTQSHGNVCRLLFVFRVYRHLIHVLRVGQSQNSSFALFARLRGSSAPPTLKVRFTFGTEAVKKKYQMQVPVFANNNQELRSVTLARVCDHGLAW